MLLGNQMDDAIIDAVDTMKMLTLRPNKCHDGMMLQMPAEALLDVTGDVDYIEATVPSGEQEDAVPVPRSQG